MQAVLFAMSSHFLPWSFSCTELRYLDERDTARCDYTARRLDRKFDKSNDISEGHIFSSDFRYICKIKISLPHEFWE